MKIIAMLWLGLLLSFNVSADSSTSIYNLNSQWLNQNASTVDLSSFAGRVRIISMIFTRCPVACPVIVSDIQHILAELPANLAEQVSVDLFSFDYERDDPKALKKFVTEMKIDQPNWSVYTGNKVVIADLAAVLGVQYKRLGNGAYIHSNNIILIDKKGDIVKTIEGYNSTEMASNEFITLLNKALTE